MAKLLTTARGRLAAEQLWVNPDCGLKTRKWPETRAAVANMVEAARLARGKVALGAGAGDPKFASSLSVCAEVSE
jgi:hypothetical protein